MIKEGQTIYLEPINNAARYSKDIKTTTVTKVGRKYFETENHGKFEIDTFKQYNGQHISNYIAYIDREALENEYEKRNIISEIEKLFKPKSMSLEKLKQIRELL